MSNSLPRALKKPWRVPAMWLLRLTVSAVVLMLIFRLVPVEEVWREARQLPPALWIAGLLIFLLGHAAAAAKWRLLIGPGASYPEAFRAHLAGLAANLCLPGVAGGDVVRAGLVYRKAADPARLTAGSLADRILDTLGLALIAVLAGFLAFGAEVAARTNLFLIVAMLGIGVAGVLAVLLASQRWLSKGRPKRMLRALAAAMSNLVKDPWRLVACLVLSMLIQSVFVFVNIAFAQALNVEAPVAAWFFAWSAAKIIAIAPVSLGGLGVREATTAALLAPFGADPARVIAVGLIWQTVLYASGLIGLIVQAAFNRGSLNVRPAP